LFLIVNFSYHHQILQLVTVRDEAWLKEEEARVRHMFKEVDEAIKMDTRWDDHGKTDKYVVPARRKLVKPDQHLLNSFHL
jgi:hypothetical protein